MEYLCVCRDAQLHLSGHVDVAASWPVNSCHHLETCGLPRPAFCRHRVKHFREEVPVKELWTCDNVCACMCVCVCVCVCERARHA